MMGTRTEDTPCACAVLFVTPIPSIKIFALRRFRIHTL